MLTTTQIEEISRIIQQRVGISTFITTGILMPGLDVTALRHKGLIPKTGGSVITDAYLFGVLMALDPSMATAPYPVIKAAIEAMPLSNIEKEAANWLSTNAAMYCKGLGNTIEATTLRIVLDAAKEMAMLGKIRETLSDAIKARKTRSQMVTLLRRSTEDVQRDWHRIVNTEIHNARTQGVAHGLRKQFGEDVTMIVQPHPDACDLCISAYTSGGKSKVFSLEVLSSRNNVGRKATELKKEPGLPPLHPHCFCEVMRFDPKIHAFDTKGRITFKKQLTKK